MALPPQPLEFVDFSGGITENYLQGDPRRYEKADNFLITVDRKLEERPGFIPYSLGGYAADLDAQYRINNFFSFINETVLIPNSGREMYVDYGQTFWTRIEGIGGRPVISTANFYSQVTSAEFQRQIYLTSDGDDQQTGSLPSKIYRDENNIWVARTAGLPRAWTTPNYTESTLLAKCLALANQLRASMISHILDAVYPSYYQDPLGSPTASFISLHENVDKYSLSYFISQSFTGYPEIPNPIPTPQGPASSEATLYDLIEALQKAYTHHMKDSLRNALGYAKGTEYPWYHQNIRVEFMPDPFKKCPRGPGATLSFQVKPDSLVDAAASLDDLHQKWNWHRLAVWTHSPQNSYSQINRYGLTESKIGKIYLENALPTVTPDYGDVIGFANNLKFLYNRHVLNITQFQEGHKRRSNFNNFGFNSGNGFHCDLPDATDLDSTFLTIYWLRALYYQHEYDARCPEYVKVRFQITAGSPNITNVTRFDTGQTYFLPPNGWIETEDELFLNFPPQLNEYDADWSYTTARVVSAAPGTATLNKNCLGISGFVTAQVSVSQYHSAFIYQVLPPLMATAKESQSTIDAQLGNPPYTVGTSTNSWLLLGEELFYAYKAHALNQVLHQNNPFNMDFPSSLELVPTPNFMIPRVAQVSYAFFFSDEYKVEANGIDYLVQGNPVFTEPTEIAISYPVDYIIPLQDVGSTLPLPVLNTRTNLLSNLPVLTNSGTTNYDLSRIELNLYRTTDGGNTYYLLDKVPNGTTSYVDSVNDTVALPGNEALNERQIIYTSGGVLGYDQPPISKFIHIVDTTVYYGAITDTGQYFPSRIVQAISGAPDAAPSANTLDLDDEITGLSSTRSNLIALCKTSIFRVSGGYNSLGQGGLEAEKISDVMGCLNAKSVVQTEIGVFFAGSDGFYYTDGFQIIKVSIDLDKTYQALTKSETQKRGIYGGYDRLGRRIWWSLKSNETDTNNDVSYVFHLDYGTKPSGAFTVQRNGLNYRPSSMVFQDGIAYMGHELGFILKTDFRAKYDSRVMKFTSASEWGRLHIPYHYKSTAVDMGSIFQRKWLTKMHLVGKNSGNMSIQPYALRDLNQTQAGRKAMAPINYVGNPTWDTPTFVWGDPNFKWEYDGKMDLWRRFPATVLRSDFMQVELTPAFQCVYSSSVDYPFGTFVDIGVPPIFPPYTFKVVTLLTPPSGEGVRFKSDCIGMEIRFPFDDYQKGYEIYQINGARTQIRVADPNDEIPVTSGVEWEIWGYKKEQRVTITSFVLHFALLGTENQSYPGKYSNSGPGNGGQNP